MHRDRTDLDKLSGGLGIHKPLLLSHGKPHPEALWNVWDVDLVEDTEFICKLDYVMEPDDVARADKLADTNGTYAAATVEIVLRSQANRTVEVPSFGFSFNPTAPLRDPSARARPQTIRSCVYRSTSCVSEWAEPPSFDHLRKKSHSSGDPATDIDSKAQNEGSDMLSKQDVAPGVLQEPLSDEDTVVKSDEMPSALREDHGEQSSKTTSLYQPTAAYDTKSSEPLRRRGGQVLNEVKETQLTQYDEAEDDDAYGVDEGGGEGTTQNHTTEPGTISKSGMTAEMGQLAHSDVASGTNAHKV